MKDKKFFIKFENKFDIESLGKEKLYKSMYDIIKDIPDNQEIKSSGLSPIFSDLFEFYKEQKKYDWFENKSISKLKDSFKRFSDNLYDYLINCFSKNEYNNIELSINFSNHNNVIDGDSIRIKTKEIEIYITNIYPNGCNQGHSTRFRFTDTNIEEELKQEISQLEVSENLKQKYLEIVKELDSDTYFNLNYLKFYLKDAFLGRINYFLEDIKDSLKKSSTLLELKLKDKILEYLKYDDDYLIDIIDILEIEYNPLNHNELIIKLFDEEIKKIRKYSYVEYDISF